MIKSKPISSIDKRAEMRINNFFKALSYLTAGVIGMLFCQLSTATSSTPPPALGGTTTGIQKVITDIQEILTGAVGTSLGTIAIVLLGFMAWSGRLSTGLAVKVIIGIVLILGAANILNLIKPPTLKAEP